MCEVKVEAPGPIGAARAALATAPSEVSVRSQSRSAGASWWKLRPLKRRNGMHQKQFLSGRSQPSTSTAASGGSSLMKKPQPKAEDGHRCQMILWRKPHFRFKTNEFFGSGTPQNRFLGGSRTTPPTTQPPRGALPGLGSGFKKNLKKTQMGLHIASAPSPAATT